MTAALEGVRVLDLSRYIPGPYCTMLLGDLGADVVKVEEPPFGDPTRALPPPVGEDSAAHAALNRNKRSLAVDLRTPAGVEVVRRLASRADVFLEAFRPGALARRGLGPEPLLAENPRLVHCSLTGYGQQGAHAGRAGHDIDYLALGGFLGSNRGPEGRPVLPLAQVADMAGALVATIGILAALHARERTGKGQVVDVSMLAGAAALMTLPATRRRAGSDPADELTDVEACVEPVLDPDEAFTAGPAAALLTEQPAGAQRLATPACPIRLKDTPASVRRPAPRLGEHTREVLAEAGYSTDQIEGMRQSGAVA